MNLYFVTGVGVGDPYASNISGDRTNSSDSDWSFYVTADCIANACATVQRYLSGNNIGFSATWEIKDVSLVATESAPYPHLLVQGR